MSLEYVEYTFPSPVDVHMHAREPGDNDSETIASATDAALHGGYQAVIDMPNNPGHPTRTIEDVAEKEDIAVDTANTNFGIYAGVDLGDPDVDSVINMLTRTLGTKFYMGRTTGNAREYVLDDARQVVDPVMDYARNEEGCGVRGRPTFLLHARDEIADETARYILSRGGRVHWCHIATAAEVAIAAAWKNDDDLPKFHTVGVTPHHLTMTDTNARMQQGWNARMAPALGLEADHEALLNAFNNEVIDILETDHAPHALDQKVAAERDNPTGLTDPGDTTCFGVSGIEFVLPIMMGLVQAKEITIKRLMDSLHTKPLEMLQLRLGQTGMRNETTVRMEPYYIGEHHLRGGSSNTPYFGWRAGCKVVQVVRDGQVVLHENPTRIQKKPPVRILNTGSFLQINSDRTNV